MEEIDKDKESQLILNLKGFAILMVVMAHCNTMPMVYSSIAGIITDICSSIATFGVWIFFVIGGYLFAYDNHSIKRLIIRKQKTLMLPWLFTGTLVYLYTYIRHNNLSLQSYFSFLSGYGSYLWYMSAYIIILLIFSILRCRKNLFLLIGLFGLIMLYPHLLRSVAGNNYNLYYFLAGAWPIAFSIGFGINSWNLRKGLVEFAERYGCLCTVAFCIIMIIQIMLEGRLYYWSILYVPLCLLFTPMIIWFVSITGRIFKKTMEELGKKSFSIYLLHMPVAGIINNICCRFDKGYSVIVRPFFVLIACFVGLRIVERLISRSSKLTWIRDLIGLR